MNRKMIFLVTVLVLSVFALKDFPMALVRAARTWVVDKGGQGDFVSIQEAVNTADHGDIVRVMSGTYYEHLAVNKSVTLIGENSSTTIIDGNETGTVVTVDTDSVSLSGFTVQKSGDFLKGVLLNQSSNSTIRENIVVSNYYGIWLDGSENNVVKDNLIRDNEWGVHLQDSDNNVLERNSVSDNHVRGLTLDSSDDNIVNENTLSNNVEGLFLESSGSDRLRDNNLTSDSFPFGVHGSELAHFIHDIDTSNQIDDKPVYYWVNQSHKQVPPDASYVAVVNSTDITVRDLNLTDQQEGVLFAYTDNSTIENLRVSKARCGLRLISCRHLSIFENTLAGNDKGIRLDYSVNNTISGNRITGCSEGIFLDHSGTNIIGENTAANNSKCMFVYYSAYNVIYHNNFMNNEMQVYIGFAKILVTNTWDWSGEGNYWSDYTGRDDGENGIGSTPYVLDRNNQDNYPLMGLFSDLVGSEESQEHLTVVSNSAISDFECNLTGRLIRFNVTGPDETLGFCRLIAPRTLLNGSYEILVDGQPPLTSRELVSSSNSTHTFLYFTYVHSMHTVIIVPEYSSALLLLLALVSLAAAFACRTRLHPLGATLKEAR